MYVNKDYYLILWHTWVSFFRLRENCVKVPVNDIP